MAHHKRRKPKHQRAGCLYCKPYKDERGSNGKVERAKGADRRRLEAAEQELKEQRERG